MSTSDLEYVGDIAGQGPIAALIVRRSIGQPEPYEVERDDLILAFERRHNETPHLLITAESVCEENRAATGHASDLHVVASASGHRAVIAWLDRR